MCAGAVSVPPAACTWPSSVSTSAWDPAGTPRLNSVELGGLDLRKQAVNFRLRPCGQAEAELGGARRPRRQARVLGQVDPFVQAEQQAPVELEERDGAVGAGDLVVKLPSDDAVGRPAKAVTVEGD
jgi:hypothetical protein